MLTESVGRLHEYSDDEWTNFIHLQMQVKCINKQYFYYWMENFNLIHR